MKLYFTAIYVVYLGFFLCETAYVKNLGAKECTWGPGYWCYNLTNAKSCHAVRHCIQTVWEKQTLPEDNDSICQICLDMVKQARDQLESNETQADLKAVFEGSCNLIPLKPVKKECIKLADDFVPELVEALASQMNPQVVCSVAGLCNNARIDEMLAEFEATTTTTTAQPPQKIVSPIIDYQPVSETSLSSSKGLTCSGCNNIATIISNKFHSSDRDEILEGLLRFCGKLSSFSDACSNIMITYFNDIYSELQKSMNSEAICHVSGVCSQKYHQHPELVEIRPLSNVGFVPIKDDIPCELCEQLVKHLRDLLVANTTETEFKQVLEGLCKQTKSFKGECLSIVDQYYDVIYNALVNNLDANGACFMIGICPKGSLTNDEVQQPIAPLLPAIPPQKIEVTIKKITNTMKTKTNVPKKLLGQNEPKYTKEEIQSMQLPIDRLLGAPQPQLLEQNGELCSLCEYFLHFLQEALSSPTNEDKIKKAVTGTCKKLPLTIQDKCDDFVDMYGDAIIALLIQEIDPSQICPRLKICPKNVNDMEVFAPQPIDVKIVSKSSTKDKPTCPLCLFAVQQAQEMIKSDKSKENIKHALDTLCSHLPTKLQDECTDFVDTYSSELVQMLITDFTPQQICVYLKLCQDKKLDLNEFNIEISYNTDADIITNTIPDETINGKPIGTDNGDKTLSPECLLCQKIIKEAEKKIVNPKNKEQVKNALEHACEKIHKKSLVEKCRDYIEKHGDLIADLIIKELTPKMICREIGYCLAEEPEDLDIDEALKIDVVAIPSTHTTTHGKFERINSLENIIALENQRRIADSPQCVICEFAMEKIEHDLKNKTTQDDIKKIVKNICNKMPKTVKNECNQFITNYADLVINLIDSVPPKEICQKLDLCVKIELQQKQKQLYENALKKHIDAFNRAMDTVVECGVCYGATKSISLMIKSDEYDHNNFHVQELIDEACEILEAKYYNRCSKLIHIYGESIVNLINSGVNKSQICARIGKCYEGEDSGLAFVSLFDNTEDSLKRIRRSPDQLLGASKCTWGPSYWCGDKTTAEECKATDYCLKKVWGKETSNN